MFMDTAQILREMGVDVWRRRRTGSDDSGEGSGKKASGKKASDKKTSGNKQPVKKPLPAAVAADRSGLDDVSAAVGREPEQKAPDAAGVPAFKVLSLLREGALLVVEPAEIRTGRRFAADLLAAVTGLWGGESRQLVFDWPQAGIENTRESMSRALAAFVNKQISDNEDGLTLIGAEVVDRLGQAPVPEDCLVLPPFEELMTRGELKRSLWKEIGRRRKS